jgi:hypothetical protein
MPQWEYRILRSWWEESDRSTDHVTRISYRHVWQPGDTTEEFASGMTANLGADGWELVTILTEHQTLLTVDSPQGNNSYGSFPVHRLFFKRPRG